MALKIRYKAPTGGGTLEIQDDATVGQLFDALKEKTGHSVIAIKYGWPPRSLTPDQMDTAITALNLHRESLTVSAERALTPPPATPQPAAATSANELGDFSNTGSKNIGDKPVTVLMPTGTYLGMLRHRRL
jgi:ubiquitin thioesterase OTU1